MSQYGVMTGWDYRATAEKLIGYFTCQDGHRDEWVDGRCATTARLACLTEGPTPERLSACDDLMATGSRYTGSGWVELQIAYSTWRTEAR